MIEYAVVARAWDGLALSGTTAGEPALAAGSPELRQARSQAKAVVARAASLPPVALLPLPRFNLFCLSREGLACVAVCSASYPELLAFAFLTELVREFLTSHGPQDLAAPTRPYHFIEFDSVVERVRQRYNRPQSLSPRVNLRELSAELRARPPVPLPAASASATAPATPVPDHGGGLGSRLEPLSWLGLVSILPAACLALLGLYRAHAVLQLSALEEYDGPSPSHGLIFLAESLLRLAQVYVLVAGRRWRSLASWALLLLAAGCVALAWPLRSPAQHAVFLGSALLSHVAVLSRQPVPDKPHYSV